MLCLQRVRCQKSGPQFSTAEVLRLSGRQVTEGIIHRRGFVPTGADYNRTSLASNSLWLFCPASAALLLPPTTVIPRALRPSAGLTEPGLSASETRAEEISLLYKLPSLGCFVIERREERGKSTACVCCVPVLLLREVMEGTAREFSPNLLLQPEKIKTNKIPSVHQL